MNNFIFKIQVIWLFQYVVVKELAKHRNWRFYMYENIFIQIKQNVLPTDISILSVISLINYKTLWKKYNYYLFLITDEEPDTNKGYVIVLVVNKWQHEDLNSSSLKPEITTFILKMVTCIYEKNEGILNKYMNVG